MNRKRGLNRIALVLSVLWFAFWVGLSIVVVLENEWDALWIVLAFAVLGFIAVWIAVWVVFYTGLYIVRGFRDDEPKDAQKQ